MILPISGSLNKPSKPNGLQSTEVIRSCSDKPTFEEYFIIRALDSRRLVALSLRSFKINSISWFHWEKHIWRWRIVTSLDRDIIVVSFDGKLFPTHMIHVCSRFSDISITPNYYCRGNPIEYLPATDAGNTTRHLTSISNLNNPLVIVSSLLSAI